jgi:hypothetical protein
LVELLATFNHFYIDYGIFYFDINSCILIIVFNGVRISCDVDAIIISDNLAIDLLYSFYTNSDISLNNTNLHYY